MSATLCAAAPGERSVNLQLGESTIDPLLRALAETLSGSFDPALARVFDALQSRP